MKLYEISWKSYSSYELFLRSGSHFEFLIVGIHLRNTRPTRTHPSSECKFFHLSLIHNATKPRSSALPKWLSNTDFTESIITFSVLMSPHRRPPSILAFIFKSTAQMGIERMVGIHPSTMGSNWNLGVLIFQSFAPSECSLWVLQSWLRSANLMILQRTRPGTLHNNTCEM